MSTKLIRMVAIVGIVTLGFAACDDDGDGFDEEAWCKIAQAFQDADGPPTAEQVAEYAEAAPSEVKDEADTVNELFESADGDIGALFSDPEKAEQFETAIGPLEAAETERCGIEHADEEEDPVETEPAEGAAIVEITGVDFGFEGVPDEVAAGSTALAFTNAGESAHEMIVVWLDKAKTLDEALAFEGDPEEEGLVETVGQAFGGPGDDTTYVNAVLTQGTYGLVCFIPGPDNKPHYELGMKAEFTVA